MEKDSIMMIICFPFFFLNTKLDFRCEINEEKIADFLFSVNVTRNEEKLPKLWKRAFAVMDVCLALFKIKIHDKEERNGVTFITGIFLSLILSWFFIAAAT